MHTHSTHTHRALAQLDEAHTSEYVLLLRVGDVLHPDAVARLVRAATLSGAAAVSPLREAGFEPAAGSTVAACGSGVVRLALGHAPLAGLYSEAALGDRAVLLRASVLREIGGMPAPAWSQPAPFAAWALYLRLLASGGRIAALPEVLTRDAAVAWNSSGLGPLTPPLTQKDTEIGLRMQVEPQALALPATTVPAHAVRTAVAWLLAHLPQHARVAPSCNSQLAEYSNAPHARALATASRWELPARPAAQHGGRRLLASTCLVVSPPAACCCCCVQPQPLAPHHSLASMVHANPLPPPRLYSQQHQALHLLTG